MKKGFTLIELLAVIIILALLMIVAVPNVLSTMNSAKSQSFVTQTQSIFKIAQQQWTKDSMKGSAKQLYSDSGDKLDLSKVATNVKYCVKFNADGTIQKLIVDDGTFRLETGSTIANLKNENITSSTGEVNCGSGSGGTGGTAYVDSVLPSAPDLGNLIPIKYNGTNWVYADVTKKWYDYTAGTNEWANAVVLADGVTKSVNDIISEGDIDLWFVWVPRYEYKLPADSIGTTETPKAIDINFVSASVTTASSGYSLHPGFKFGSDWKSGLWLGKFESTAATISGDGTNAAQTVKITANVISWRNVQNVYMYTSSLNIDTLYGLTGLDSHMTRYTEWTTMSYLSNSIYGRCANATTCTEITINNPPGCPEGCYLTGGGNYEINGNQSTTGNVYGIYDVNGGASEIVMGYLSGASGLYAYDGFTSSTIPTDNKYTDIFTSSNHSTYNYSVITGINGGTSMNGVFSELLSTKTSERSWFGDSAYFVDSSRPWFLLGGMWNDSIYAGAFSSSISGGSAAGGYGFRVALCAI